MLVRVGAALSGVGLVFTLVNRVSLGRLLADGVAVDEPVTVLVPARDEAARVGGLLGDLRAQRGVPQMRVFLLDDDSSDRTFEVASAAVEGDPRFVVLRGVGGPPAGWVGKQWACARLAEAAGAADGVLVFLDADVRLAPGTVVAAVGALRSSGLGLLSPWPAQVAGSWAERLIQPLLAWSWAASLPVVAANRSLLASTAVACGQFLVVDAAGYRRVGGHGAVASSVTEDLALARCLRRSGARTAVLPVGSLASCRMYCGAAEVDAGYARWLWSSYGGVVGSAAVAGVVALAYLVPPVAVVTGRGRRWGVAGYAAGVGSRLLARSMEGGPVDVVAALAHPVSVVGYLVLLARSHCAHRRGRTVWRGRRLC
ncbi:MAG TPA: glycosyltransferase family 2 protein [Aldersonia sp.]